MATTANIYVKMHTGDPGAAGTANPAANTTRKQVTFHDELVPLTLTLSQSEPIAYTGGEVTTTESYAWVSFWDSPTAGNNLGKQDIPNQAATATQALTIPAGTIQISDRKVIDDVLRAAVFVDRVSNRQYRHRYGSLRANAAARQRAKFATQTPQTI